MSTRYGRTRPTKKRRGKKRRTRKKVPTARRVTRVKKKAPKKAKKRSELDLDGDWLAPVPSSGRSRAKPRVRRLRALPSLRAPRAATTRRAVPPPRAAKAARSACPFCPEDHGGDGHPFEKWTDEESRAHRVPRAQIPRRDFAVVRNHRYRNDPKMTGEE